jgi:hypothetical protein
MIANGIMTIAKAIVTNSGNKQPRRPMPSPWQENPRSPPGRLSKCAAHVANLEQPDTFNQIVVAFASKFAKGEQS